MSTTTLVLLAFASIEIAVLAAWSCAFGEKCVPVINKAFAAESDVSFVKIVFAIAMSAQFFTVKRLMER